MTGPEFDALEQQFKVSAESAVQSLIQLIREARKSDTVRRSVNEACENTGAHLSERVAAIYEILTPPERAVIDKVLADTGAFKLPNKSNGAAIH